MPLWGVESGVGGVRWPCQVRFEAEDTLKKQL